MDSMAPMSKAWASTMLRTNPASSRSHMGLVIPPMAKLMWMFFSSMMGRSMVFTAREAPPAPVWKEKPSLKKGDSSMSLVQ